MSLISWLFGDRWTTPLPGQHGTVTVEDWEQAKKEFPEWAHSIKAPLPGQHGTVTVEEINISSPTWGYISAWAQEELAKLRNSNDIISKGEIPTAVVRGEIRCLKKLLALPDLSTKLAQRKSLQKGILEDDDGNEW